MISEIDTSSVVDETESTKVTTESQMAECSTELMRRPDVSQQLFAFGFERRIEILSLLISRLINIALLVADHISIKCCFSSLTSLTGF